MASDPSDLLVFRGWTCEYALISVDDFFLTRSPKYLLKRLWAAACDTRNPNTFGIVEIANMPATHVKSHGQLADGLPEVVLMMTTIHKLSWLQFMKGFCNACTWIEW